LTVVTGEIGHGGVGKVELVLCDSANGVEWFEKLFCFFGWAGVVETPF
jgi:hypothetical protein